MCLEVGSVGSRANFVEQVIYDSFESQMKLFVYIKLQMTTLFDLPYEIQVRYLVDLRPEELLAYCLTSSKAYDMCKNHEFLSNYVHQKYQLNLDRIPGETNWEAFVHLNSIINRSEKIEVEEEDRPWDPFDRPEKPRWRISPEVGDLVLEAVQTGYPKLVQVVLKNLMSRIYEDYDLGNIIWLKDAFDEAVRQNQPEIINLLLPYYEPTEVIDSLLEPPINSTMIMPYVYQYPELAWMLLYRLGPEGEEEHPELARFLWEHIRTTQRYNRLAPIPFYYREIQTIETYARHRRDLIDKYNQALLRAERYIRPS